jgi:hypothetical protein
LIEGAAAAAAEVVNLSVGSGLKGSRRTTTRPCSLCQRQGVAWDFDDDGELHDSLRSFLTKPASDKKITSFLIIFLPNLGNNIF